MSRPEPSPSEYTLFPKNKRKGVTLESKAKFNQRLESQGCCLELNECKQKHLDGCLSAMRKFREYLKGNWKIADPRFDEPRNCTVEEVYWYLINDPRSAWSLNYGRSDRMTSEEYFMEYAGHLGLDGRFLTGNELLISNEKQSIQPHKPVVEPVPAVAPVAVPAVKSTLPASGKDPDEDKASQVDWSEKKPWKMTEVIRWVFDNMKNPSCDISSAPCPGAISLLRWAEHKGGDSQFFTYFLTKLVPSQKDLEAAEKRSDNGSNLFPLLDELLQDIED